MSVNATTNSPDQPFSFGPSPHVDTVGRVSQLLGLAGVIPCTLVCKTWHNTMQNPSIWFTLFDTESIPRIAEHDVDTAKEDFQFMYPRTHGAKQMAPLGRFVGIVPQVDPVVFEVFRTMMDPYDPTRKMSETWVFVVEPESIHRDDVDEVLLNALKTEGDFDTDAEIDDLKKQGVLIPYSLKNLKVCADHPVTNKGTKVFGYFNADVLQQCSTISKAVRVTLMRKEVPESTRNKTWPQQKAELAKNGHVPVKLSTRGFYNATNILNKGTCPDKQEGTRSTFSRTSDEIKFGNNVRPSAIGGFAPGAGVYVYYNPHNANDNRGAAPAVPAEVRSSVLGPLAPENGT
jgi:hypothetical protein